MSAFLFENTTLGPRKQSLVFFAWLFFFGAEIARGDFGAEKVKIQIRVGECYFSSFSAPFAISKSLDVFSTNRVLGSLFAYKQPTQETKKQTNEQTNRQTSKQTNQQTNKQTNKQKTKETNTGFSEATGPVHFLGNIDESNSAFFRRGSLYSRRRKNRKNRNH